MVLQVVLVLGDKRTLGALQQLLRLDVHVTLMHPVVLFIHTDKYALFTFVHFCLIGATALFVRCHRVGVVAVAVVHIAVVVVRAD